MSDNKKLPGGVWPVAVTPFKDDLSIDYKSYEKLLEFYLDSGCSGIFAVCLSSEFYHLSAEEQLELAKITKDFINGRIPVVASAYLGDNEKSQKESLSKMLELEPDATVIIVNQVEGDGKSSTLLKNIAEIVRFSGGAPLGLYECPVPRHRLLSPQELAVIAKESNLVFLKDTCCDLGQLRLKAEAVEGTPLAIFNANLRTFPESLKYGVHGYNGTCANFLPEVIVRGNQMALSGDYQSQEFLELYELLMLCQQFLIHSYPASAKAFLKMRGITINHVCRKIVPEYTPDTSTYLENFYNYAIRIMEKYNIPVSGRK